MKKHLNANREPGRVMAVRLFISRSTAVRLSDQAERQVMQLMAAVLAIMALIGFVIWNGTGRTTMNRITAPNGMMLPHTQSTDHDFTVEPLSGT